jgi:hypothetical protein
MNSTNKEKLVLSIIACEEGEHNFTHELSTITMKCWQCIGIWSAREK